MSFGIFRRKLNRFPGGGEIACGKSVGHQQLRKTVPGCSLDYKQATADSHYDKKPTQIAMGRETRTESFQD